MATETESPLDLTIREGREYLNSQMRRRKAAKCPCCTQTVKVYPRKIYSTMARGLIELYKMNALKPDYYHIGTIESMRQSGGGDFAKLTYWGLVEEMPKDAAQTNQRTSGYWRITEQGKEFVMNNLRVPEFVDVFNGNPLRMYGDPVGIQDALGKDFDYEELMR